MQSAPEPKMHLKSAHGEKAKRDRPPILPRQAVALSFSSRVVQRQSTGG